MLRDHNQNEIEVAIEKKNGKVYFADFEELLWHFGWWLGHSNLCKSTSFPD